LFFDRQSSKIECGRFVGEAGGEITEMTGWMKWLGLTIAAAWMTFAMTTPAHADFTVCNKSSYKVYVAFGYWDGSQKAWTSEGWWTLETGGCAVVYRHNLDAQKYYVYAESVNNDYDWKGEFPFCANDEKFTAIGDTDCKSRGYYSVNFFEVDVGDNRDWETDLTD
jgi:uncharacterized membrane protein